MSLSDTEIWTLAEKMDVPLVFAGFKDQLKRKKLQYNKSYIINMENEFDEDGFKNTGSHYTCFQVNKYKNGKIEGVYFDSFGMPPPEIVEKFVGRKLPYPTKDVQSLLNSACGWFCLAFLHLINAWEGRSGDLYTDAGFFTDLFDDLNHSTDHLKNEWVLKHFFRSSNEDDRRRKPVELHGFGASTPEPNPDTIITEDDDYKTKL